MFKVQVEYDRSLLGGSSEPLFKGASDRAAHGATITQVPSANTESMSEVFHVDDCGAALRLLGEALNHFSSRPAARGKLKKLMVCEI